MAEAFEEERGVTVYEMLAERDPPMPESERRSAEYDHWLRGVEDGSIRCGQALADQRRRAKRRAAKGRR